MCVGVRPCPGCWGHSGHLISLVPALREEQVCTGVTVQCDMLCEGTQGSFPGMEPLTGEWKWLA